MDLSAPHDIDDINSINDLICKEECSLAYVKIDDAIKLYGNLVVFRFVQNLISNQLSNSLVSVEISVIYFVYNGIKHIIFSIDLLLVVEARRLFLIIYPELFVGLLRTSLK